MIEFNVEKRYTLLLHDASKYEKLLDVLKDSATPNNEEETKMFDDIKDGFKKWSKENKEDAEMYAYVEAAFWIYTDVITQVTTNPDDMHATFITFDTGDENDPKVLRILETYAEVKDVFAKIDSLK